MTRSHTTLDIWRNSRTRVTYCLTFLCCCWQFIFIWYIRNHFKKTGFWNGIVSCISYENYLIHCYKTWHSWIRALWYNYESNQQDATMLVNLLFLVSPTCFGRCFRPSSGELDYLHLVIFTNVAALELCSNASMTPADSDIGEYYQMLYIESSAPDDGRKHRPKHVELTRNNKLTYIVASCWLLS
jgi:hypothetical protein